MPAHLQFRSSFDFPPKLTTKAYAEFQRVSSPMMKAAEDADGLIPSIMFQAIHVRAANQAGLILNWKSDLIQRLDEDNGETLENEHIKLVRWVGQEVIDWIGEPNLTPKVSFLRWLTQWTELVRLRWSSSKPGASTG